MSYVLGVELALADFVGAVLHDRRTAAARTMKRMSLCLAPDIISTLQTGMPPLRVNCCGLADAPDPDFLLTLAGLRDVERRLHPH